MKRSRELAYRVAAFALCLLAAAPLPAHSPAAAKPVEVSLRAADLLAVRDPAFERSTGQDRFDRFRKVALGGARGEVLAFEENRWFTIVVTEAPRESSAGEQGDNSPSWIRRLVLLKPSTFLVYDQLHASPGRSISLALHSAALPEVSGRRLRITEPVGELLGETLAPDTDRLAMDKDPTGVAAPAGHVVRVAPAGNREVHWAFHLFHIRSPGGRSTAQAEPPDKTGRWKMTAGDRVFRLWLPPWHCEPGDVAVEKPKGEMLFPRRPLPAGVLPYTPEGIQLLDRWDSAYRDSRHPAWDTGRPSSELKKLVEDGTLRRCRAVDLGCGSGTNAIYLAGKGFDVIGIDLAPTALARAEEKAREAKVRAHWLLADVVRPPELKPFQLIFDRGCYHGLRARQAAEYVEALRRLSKPGTRVLILAGNANEQAQYGPPRVKEEDIRRDFARLFDIELLRETRFDTADPARPGALAWSILLRRKAEPSSPQNATLR